MKENFGAARYADVLRAIGQRFDAQGYQDIVLCEVVDGYIARGAHGDDAPPEGSAFSLDELESMVAALAPAPPADGEVSYANLLGALGRELDRVEARMITVMELSLGLLVQCYPTGYQTEGCYGERYEFLYEPEAIPRLLASGHEAMLGTAALYTGALSGEEAAWDDPPAAQ